MYLFICLMFCAACSHGSRLRRKRNAHGNIISSMFLLTIIKMIILISEKAMSIPSKSQPSPYFGYMIWVGILLVYGMGCGQNVDSVLVYSVRT